MTAADRFRYLCAGPLGVSVAGVLTSLGYAPVEQPVLTILGVALYLLVVASPTVKHASRRRLLALGGVYACSFMAPLLWWINAIGAGAYVALVLVLAVLLSPLALALRWAMAQRLWAFWASAIWVSFESLRSSIPLGGFPWGRLAHVSVDTPFASYTRYLGTPATSAVMVLVAAAVTSVLMRRSFRALVVGISMIVAIAGFGAILPIGPSSPNGTREVALVQGDVPEEFGAWPRGAIFDKHLEANGILAEDIKTGVRPPPDFVVWPENSTDIDPTDDPEAALRLTRAVQSVGAPILVGGILDGPDATTAYNAGFVWTSAGEGDRYIKRNLVPFGEYVPFRQSVGRFVPRFDRDIPRDMISGRDAGSIAIAGVPLGAMICWDVAHDDAIRDVIQNGAQLLSVQTSNASFTGTSQPAQQWQISRLRAIETGRDIVVASTNGISGIVNSRGDAIAQAPTRDPAVVSATVELAQGMTPGVRFGGWLERSLIVVVIVGGLRGRYQKASRKLWQGIRLHRERSHLNESPARGYLA